MKMINYVVPTKEELEQFKEYLVGKVESLPYLRNYVKDAEYYFYLAGTLELANEQLTKERDDYKEAADNLLEKLKEEIDLRPLKESVGEGYVVKGDFHDSVYKDGNPVVYNKTESLSPGLFGPGRHSDGSVDEFEKQQDELDVRRDIISRSDVDKSDKIFKTAPNRPAPEYKRTKPYTNEERAKRREEAHKLELLTNGNTALMVKAMSNRNRVEAELDGLVAETRTGELIPYKVYTYTDGIPVISYNSKKTKDIPASKAVFKMYDFNRMSVELYDKNDKLLNPTVEKRPSLFVRVWRRIAFGE